MIAEKCVNFIIDINLCVRKLGLHLPKPVSIEGYIPKLARLIQTFTDLYPYMAGKLKKYHFNNHHHNTQECLMGFNALYSAKRQPLPEAQILYDKGFDHTDLLMLADLVEDEDVAEALRTATIFRRGFWALDILREL